MLASLEVLSTEDRVLSKFSATEVSSVLSPRSSIRPLTTQHAARTQYSVLSTQYSTPSLGGRT
jgi:hypothetical protein